MDDPSWDLVYQSYFHERLEEYLNGVGHPDHPDVRAVVGEARFLADANDPLLRTRLFLQMMTGSDLLPMDTRDLTASVWPPLRYFALTKGFC